MSRLPNPGPKTFNNDVVNGNAKLLHCNGLGCSVHSHRRGCSLAEVNSVKLQHWEATTSADMMTKNDCVVALLHSG